MMIISDNGTEFTSNAILAFADKRKVDWHYSAPGKPTQSGFIESCSIPGDHIDPRRSAFSMARSVLRDIRDGVRILGQRDNTLVSAGEDACSLKPTR